MEGQRIFENQVRGEGRWSTPYLVELFPEFFPEHPYAAGTLAGILVYVTGHTYSTFVTFQKENITEIILQRGDVKKLVASDIEIVRKTVEAEFDQEKVEKETDVEEEIEVEQSVFEAFLDKNGIEIGRVNILENKEKAMVLVRNLQKLQDRASARADAKRIHPYPEI